jgi:hypothetical protein
MFGHGGASSRIRLETDPEGRCDLRASLGKRGLGEVFRICGTLAAELLNHRVCDPAFSDDKRAAA